MEEGNFKDPLKVLCEFFIVKSWLTNSEMSLEIFIESLCTVIHRPHIYSLFLNVWVTIFFSFG